MDWKRRARQLLRAELAKAGVSYGQLATRLQKAGIDETERSIPNKMSRGTFSFAFFLQCMHALGKTSVTLDMTDSAAPENKAPPKRPVGPQPEATGLWLEPTKVVVKGKVSRR